MPKLGNGVCMHKKGYLWIKAGPCRDQLVHRLVAAAYIGRELDKSEEIHHIDADKRNPHWMNLLVLGSKDHSWVSQRQAHYMRTKDLAEKREWDEFMAERDAEFRREVMEAKSAKVAWRMRKDGKLESKWKHRNKPIATATVMAVCGCGAFLTIILIISIILLTL